LKKFPGDYKMKILDLYFIRKFLVTFFLIIGIFVLIAIIFDFAEKVDDFVKNQAPLKAIVFEYYVNFVPYFMNLFSPLLIFISAVYFTSRMAANTEIVAMLTNGVNYYRLLVPYFIVALMLASLSWYLNSWVIPNGNKKEQAFEEKYILNKFMNTDNHIHRQIEPGIFIYLQSYDAQDSFGYKFTLERFNKYRMVSKLEAQNIRWNNATGKWDLANYNIRTIDSFSEKYQSGRKMSLSLPISPSDFGRKTLSIQSMNNRELKEYIAKEKLRGEELVTFYEIEKYRRFGMPFATFILVLIAFSISSRKIRGGTGLHLAFGILIAFTYVLFMQFSSVFATKADLNPLLAVWIPNILYTLLGGFLLVKAPK
jgi:lipopolysaccharide export system permease protein